MDGFAPRTRSAVPPPRATGQTDRDTIAVLPL